MERATNNAGTHYSDVSQLIIEAVNVVAQGEQSILDVSCLILCSQMYARTVCVLHDGGTLQNKQTHVECLPVLVQMEWVQTHPGHLFQALRTPNSWDKF